MFNILMLFNFMYCIKEWIFTLILNKQKEVYKNYYGCRIKFNVSSGRNGTTPTLSHLLMPL